LKIAEANTDEVEWADDLVFDNYDELRSMAKLTFSLGRSSLLKLRSGAPARTKEKGALPGGSKPAGNIKLINTKIYQDGAQT
jgi:hypothetical protein